MSDSKPGFTVVSVDRMLCVNTMRQAVLTFQAHGARAVTLLGVAGLIVKVQAHLSGDTVDATIALMRRFMDLFDETDM